MRTLSLSLLLALSPIFSTAFPLVKRQSDLASELISEITTIGDDLTTLNNTLNTFTADSILGAVKALEIQAETSQVSTDLTKAANIAKASSNFTSDESGDIATAVVDLEPIITSVLNNIVTHKPAFATAILFVGDISETVEQDLEQQSQLSTEFSDALIAKLAEPYSSLAPLVADEIQSAFTTAIDAYESCTGLICLPPLRRRI